MYYAGIGPRKTPENILKFMTSLAKILGREGYILRSGGAKGADTAFANGALKKEIFRPHCTTKEAIDLAMGIHPAPKNCNDYVRKLHGRNAQIILGKNLDSPVNFVLCWTLAKHAGGTALGIRLANERDIKVYNFASDDDIKLIQKRFIYVKR